MIFLKRYKKYCVRPDKYTNTAINDILCMFDYSSSIINPPNKYVFSAYYGYGYNTMINTALPLDRVCINYLIRKKIIQGIDITDSYSLASGYVREIGTYNFINGKRVNEVKLIRTFICSAELASAREAYYNLLKGHFLCRIFN